MIAVDVASARELFDANATTYDRVNTVVSLGLDSRWRDWAASQAFVRVGARILDAFSGTGKLALEEAALGGRVTMADASPGMLEVATKRARERDLHLSAVTTDLSADPLVVTGAPFDAVTAMWGLRYVDDPAHVIANLASQLVDSGRLVLVEFVEPGDALISQMAAYYFFRILPRIASTLAGRRELYHQLVETTHHLGPVDRLVEMVDSAGLKIVEVHMMGFGLVCGIVAEQTDGAA